jgi:hypothetical protein
MFVSRGMINNQGPVRAEHIVKASTILDASDLGVEWDGWECLTHFPVDFKER